MKDAKGHGSSGRGRVEISVNRPISYTIHDVGPGGVKTLSASGTFNPHEGTVNNGGGYYARASAKGGRALGDYGPHSDRDNAAAEAWAKHPNARQVSTSRGPHGMDVQWHNSPTGKGGTGFGRILG